MRSLILIQLAVVICAAVDIGDDLSFNMELIKHQSCSHSDSSKWSQKIEFEGGNDRKGPKLEALEGQKACYAIGGKVNVHEEFSGDFSIYLELRNTANKKAVPESCQKQGEDGCGGFGSCLYCNACKTFGDVQGVKAQLLLDGKPIKCSDGLKKGTYENLQLVFCLPRIEEILKSQGLTKESFLQLVQSDDGRSLRAMGIFATVYVFDTDVSKQMQTQQRIEGVYRKTKKSFFKDEPLPADVYWSLPFNKMIKEQREFVACHKIYGNIRLNGRKL